MLVDRVRRRRIIGLSSASALLAIAASTITLLDFHVYDDALMPGLLLGTLGFDAMSLLVGLGLLGCLRAIATRREQYWLLWLGLQGYLLYAYSIYAFGLIYTKLYFVYVAIVGLSAYALAGFALHCDTKPLRHWRLANLPHRIMGALLVAIGALFATGWTMMLADALSRRQIIDAGIVLVLDLAFALPLLVIVGLLLYRSRPLGDLLAPGVYAMAAAITLAVAIGEFMRPIFGDGVNLWPATPYLIPGAVCLSFALLAFRRVSPSITHPRHREA